MELNIHTAARFVLYLLLVESLIASSIKKFSNPVKEETNYMKTAHRRL